MKLEPGSELQLDGLEQQRVVELEAGIGLHCDSRSGRVGREGEDQGRGEDQHRAMVAKLADAGLRCCAVCGSLRSSSATRVFGLNPGDRAKKLELDPRLRQPPSERFGP